MTLGDFERIAKTEVVQNDMARLLVALAGAGAIAVPWSE
jgi:hypothetical protein